MMDQARSLRNKINHIKKGKQSKAIAVVSGKGGVGKSNFSLNFSLGLTRSGSNVLLFDLDVGMGNIDILMGLSSKHTIVDMFEGNRGIHEIIEKGPEGLSYIAGGTGLSRMFKFDQEKSNYFVEQLNILSQEYEYLIFDMGAGISDDSLQFILAADEIVLVTTPEPTSITDAYAVMKYIHLREKNTPFYLMVNRVISDKQAKATLKRLSEVANKFLNKELHFLGDLPDDRVVGKAVYQQLPFLLYDVKSKPSQAIIKMVKRYSEKNFDHKTSTSSYGFIAKFKQYFLER